MDLKFYIVEDEDLIKKILYEFRNDMFKKKFTNGYFQELAKKFAISARFILLKKGENNIGYIAFYCNDNINRRAYISMIVVKNSYQCRGIGKRLLEESISISKEVGMQVICLEVAKENISARKFYIKQGFIKTEENINSYIMEKRI